MNSVKDYLDFGCNYIRKLYTNTKNGELEIYYERTYGIAGPYTHTWKVDWIESDVDNLVLNYKYLVENLYKIAQHHDALEDETQRVKLLTEEEQMVWETYIRPYEPFEVDLQIIAELYDRGEFNTLTDDENELMERHYEWNEGESLKRLPFVKRSPSELILRARRFEQLVSLNAPELVIKREIESLAEEMLFYYHIKKNK